MKTVNVQFYYLSRKKDDAKLKELFAQKSGWAQENIDEFLSKNDSAIFHKKTVPEATELIREFQQIGIIGAINGLQNVPYYTKKFQQFYEASERFKLTWNWASAIFNWIWQLCSGLWAKCILYGGISLLLSWLLYFLPYSILGMTGTVILSLVFGVGGFLFYGFVGNYDYFLKKTRNENFWPSFPFRKYKTPFWILSFIGFAVGLILFWIQAKAVMATQLRMMNPTISQGKVMQLEGVEFAPLPGWQVISGIPGSSQPPFFEKTQANTMLLIMGRQVGEQEQTKIQGQAESDNAFGQILLSVYSPNGNNSFHSLDQKEVQGIIGPIAKGFNQTMFKLILKEVQTSEPVFMEVNGQKWAKIATSIQFRGARPEEAFLNIVYYTVASNKLVVLYLQSSIEGNDKVEKDIEQFVKTFGIGKGDGPDEGTRYND